MGNEGSASNGRADGKSSLGNFSDKGSFGQAFHAAHAAGGSGHTFSYNDKLYNTNCKDGGDYRKTQDNRIEVAHKVSETWHRANAALKDSTGTHLLDKTTMRGYTWTADVDRQRVEYHKNEYNKKT